MTEELMTYTELNGWFRNMQEMTFSSSFAPKCCVYLGQPMLKSATSFIISEKIRHKNRINEEGYFSPYSIRKAPQDNKSPAGSRRIYLIWFCFGSTPFQKHLFDIFNVGYSSWRTFLGWGHRWTALAVEKKRGGEDTEFVRKMLCIKTNSNESMLLHPHRFYLHTEKRHNTWCDALEQRWKYHRSK